MSDTTVRALIASAAIGSALILATPSLAQGGGGGDRGGFGGGGDLSRIQYTSRDLQRLESILELADDQEVIVDVFFDTYSQTFNELTQRMRDEVEFRREQMRLARETEQEFDPGQWERLRTEMERYRTEGELANEEFISSVRSVLLEEQLERWPIFERAMRRTRQLPRGRLSGESVDLFNVVESIDLAEPDRDAVQPILNDYDLQLDAALQRRDSLLEGAGGEAMRSAFRDLFRGEATVREVENVFQREHAVRMGVRDVNLRYADQITQAMGDPAAAAAFEEAFSAAAFPRIYRSTYAAQAFEAALALDLEQHQRQQIETLHQTFEMEIARRNEALERLTRLEEPREAQRRVEEIAARMNGSREERSEDPIDDAYDAREEYEAQVVARLHDVLSEEQIRSLPRRPQQRDEGRGWGGGDRGGDRGGGNRGGFGGGRGRGG